MAVVRRQEDTSPDGAGETARLPGRRQDSTVQVLEGHADVDFIIAVEAVKQSGG